MRLLIDSFWRAVGYCLLPRVVALSLLPLLVIALLTGLFWYLWWDGAVASINALLAGSGWLSFLWGWLQAFGVEGPALLAPVLLVVLVTPAIVVLSVLAVAILMAPALVSLVAQRRFPSLERRGSASFLASAAWSLGSTVAALVALTLSIPLWFIPPLVLVLPPLIWGWLTYRVMAFDALGEHADKAERELIMRQYRMQLLGIGVVTGYLGAAPGIVWASSVVFAAAFVVLIPVAVWIYTLVFAFSSLWFAHYCLAALDQLRTSGASGRVAAAAPGVPGSSPLPVVSPTSPPGQQP
ncbi:putative transmembrane protein [Paracidovorax avenae ATCC 19860]|uniref:Putative transmembrane protein n=1 Tax=Paracidovorax avenae (strain ATCC 19860 / DSM 7227 / CCUG 15838 / JCM 20985 / LMG 2117 / NCPPB 1011) TaxID=643561 RepID=F0Q2Z9_PARA1|nr:EI24 domain-containing protein [Paracidovorax avenae]ADX45401.1 putative transmembrane protein [Paracidovorax avenae ATCC 19860]